MSPDYHSTSRTPHKLINFNLQISARGREDNNYYIVPNQKIELILVMHCIEVRQTENELEPEMVKG